ncbi:MAG: cation:proton antiporter [Clostridia bacterium]|nr:cation:proton antiporter [Clostridia bacterium]
MEVYSILLPLGLILVFSKILVILCKKVSLPGVVGMLLSGLILLAISYIPKQPIINDTSKNAIKFCAEIGVILIMFSAGLGTNLKQIKAVGKPTIFITLAGILLPMGLGFLVAVLFNGGFGAFKENLYGNLFYGTILTATSVSITVATLKELGVLGSKAGTTIVSSAILDDILGVVILSFILSISGKSESSSDNPLIVLLLTIIYFGVVIILKLVVGKLFKYLDKKYPHHRRIPIFSIGFCFIFAWISQEFFGIADITGAFAAGLILSDNFDKEYIDRKAETLGYMFFTPVFFANVGLSLTFSAIKPSFILFGTLFIFVGILGKLLGCGLTAKACKYSFKDSLRVGVGMMARAEVALVCAQTGINAGLISPNITPFLLILIIITSFATPLIIKGSYKGELTDKMLEDSKPIEIAQQ